MQYQYNDGGRAAAGFKGAAGDCVTRAIAIACGLPYGQVYAMINQASAQETVRSRQRRRSSARTGVYKDTTRKVLHGLGWTWTPTMGIGQGCSVHLRQGELPAGRLIVKLSGHLVAVIDGTIHDTFDPSRQGSRCVYGYWTKPEGATA